MARDLPGMPLFTHEAYQKARVLSAMDLPTHGGYQMVNIPPVYGKRAVHSEFMGSGYVS
ncbi:hypothetical protein [Membranihabitans maritimus]|uniref:hypothetical protein n=1 Tax=Membranihabitans maritimus TaxID=2904244 RepID=UPI001F3725B7|nr:hypothetical protein [Membranihabitans maritimus]